MAKPNDGTALGTGEVISGEQIDPTDSHADSNLPATGYKVPRSKIANGPYGRDDGDVTPDNPFPVDSPRSRRTEETEVLTNIDTALNTMGIRQDETVSLCDRRGRALETRGMR